MNEEQTVPDSPALIRSPIIATRRAACSSCTVHRRVTRRSLRDNVGLPASAHARHEVRAFGRGHGHGVVVGARRWRVRGRAGRRVDKYVAPPEQYKIGQTLLITAKGPSPSTLVVIRDRELTIRNDTDIPQMLTFVNSDVDDKGNTSLGPIAPGEQLVYKPPFPISMVYTVDGDGIDGTLQVDTGEFSP